MKFIPILCLFGFLLGSVPSIAQVNSALPADQQQWLTCDEDKDCTPVDLGCWYWQPVSKKHAVDMENAHIAVCTASIDPGPQPPSICAKHVCENGPLPRK